jgi:hypothetical protein
MRVFDQSRTERRFDDERTIPPDGKLQRDELPIKAFGAIDRLTAVDGAIDETELSKALARLSAADQQLVLAETTKTTTELEATGKRFLPAFASFAGGGLALMGGLFLSGPVGLGIAAVGGVGIVVGFGAAIGTIIKGGRQASSLAETLDGVLSRATL